MASTFKRSRILVDSSFQLNLLGRMLLYFFVIAFTGFHVAFFYEAMISIATNGIRKPLAELYLDFLHQQRTILFAFATLAPILLYDMLKFSHRIAGPLYRCRKIMLEMAEGKPVPAFKPRKHDMMRDLFRAFNELIVAWNHRVGPQAETVSLDEERAQPAQPPVSNNVKAAEHAAV